MASTFSYAQAAKGIATPSSTSKPAPRSAASVKDGVTTGSAPTWAEDVGTEAQPDGPKGGREPRPQTSSSTAARVSRSADTSSVSSPDLAASSSSTVTKDDDVSSLPNTSSESTWDNKSQTSTSVDKTTDTVEKTSEKVKKGKNVVVKPLVDAPPPAVNPWKILVNDVKGNVNKVPMTNGTPQVLTKKSELGNSEKASVAESRMKGRDETPQARKEMRGVKGRFMEKDANPASSVLPPPPNHDQESWPTPETAIDEDRKKAQEKGEKVEKERKEGGPTGKHEWVKVPYTPSVVFNTPLPNAANSRRGGRPGGRAGAQSSGRPTGSSSNGVGQSERDNSMPESTNAELAKQERPEDAPVQDASMKEKRTSINTSPTVNGQMSESNGVAPSKANAPTPFEFDGQLRKVSELSHATGQNNPCSRQYPNRPNKGRRGDLSSAGERRRNGEITPHKDNTLDERRVSAGTQADTTGDADRQGAVVQEGLNGHHSKQSRFGSFSSGRERGRGGRSARASYSNGHQFTNGHQSMHTSNLPMGPQSPTTFNPGNTSFFTASQSKYGRNGHRSQSVTTDAYRYSSYQNGPPGTPIQTYNMYDYGMMQPMSSMPFAYGVDYHALIAMITTQVEYYFSVDNLLKDMYLRRHMDSQGFVSLEFIAGFNRIKTLSTDLDIIKIVCQQSGVIEYRIGEDGQDRLRRREGWAQWVLNMAERDPSAQNEGPKELHQPPVPHPASYEQTNASQWTPVPTAIPFGNGAYAQVNGDLGVAQDNPSTANETESEVLATSNAHGAAVLNGHAHENSTKA